MIILAIETAQSPAVVLWRDGKILASCILEAKGRQTDALHELIRQALQEAHLKAYQIERVAVGLGPGSFTGLRIGAAAAAAWAWARKIPVYGLSRMEAIARILLSQSSAAAPVWVVLDAGRSNVYAACYRRTPSGRVEVKTAPKLLPKKDRVLTVLPGLEEISCEFAVMAQEKSRRPANPLRLLPDYLYPRDCNVTLA